MLSPPSVVRPPPNSFCSSSISLLQSHLSQTSRRPHLTRLLLTNLSISDSDVSRSTDYLSLVHLGTSFLHLGRFVESVGCFLRAVQLQRKLSRKEEDDPVVLVGLSRALFGANRWESCVRVCGEILQGFRYHYSGNSHSYSHSHSRSRFPRQIGEEKTEFQSTEHKNPPGVVFVVMVGALVMLDQIDEAMKMISVWEETREQQQQQTRRDLVAIRMMFLKSVILRLQGNCWDAIRILWNIPTTTEKKNGNRNENRDQLSDIMNRENRWVWMQVLLWKGLLLEKIGNEVFAMKYLRDLAEVRPLDAGEQLVVLLALRKTVLLAERLGFVVRAKMLGLRYLKQTRYADEELCRMLEKSLELDGVAFIVPLFRPPPAPEAQISTPGIRASAHARDSRVAVVPSIRKMRRSVHRAALIFANEYSESSVISSARSDVESVAHGLFCRKYFVRVIRINESRAKFVESFRSFLDVIRLASSEGVLESVVVYFSGHCISFGNEQKMKENRNYLIPHDFRGWQFCRTPTVASERYLQSRAVRFLDIVDSLGMATSDRVAKLVLLDCCRENPSSARGMRVYSNLPPSTICVFSSQPDTITNIWGVRTSFFARSLKKLLVEGTEFNTLYMLLKQVEETTFKLTHRRQRPFFFGTLEESTPLTKCF